MSRWIIDYLSITVYLISIVTVNCMTMMGQSSRTYNLAALNMLLSAKQLHIEILN